MSNVYKDEIERALAHVMSQVRDSSNKTLVYRDARARLSVYIRDMMNKANVSPTALEKASQLHQGPFIHDLVTAQDVGEWFRMTPRKAGGMLKTHGAFDKRIAQVKGKSLNLWIVRNHDDYEQMRSSELYRAYEDMRSTGLNPWQEQAKPSIVDDEVSFL